MQARARPCRFLWHLVPIFLFQDAVIAATSTAALASTTATCWYPDTSTVSHYDVPCNDGGDGFSACCHPEHLCLSNGYCIGDGTALGRGSCTDQSWSDPACPQQCRDVGPQTSIILVHCNQTENMSYFACHRNATSCAEDSFVLPDYNYILRAQQVAPFGLSSAITISTSVSATMSAAAVPSTSGTSSLSSSNSSISSLSSITSGTPSLSLVTPATSVTCTAEGTLQAAVRDQQRKVVAVGAGVGAPLGMLFLSFLTLFLLERQKKRIPASDNPYVRMQPPGAQSDLHGQDKRSSRPAEADAHERIERSPGPAEADEHHAMFEMGGLFIRPELGANSRT